eukprot:TRINITY_DN21149_c0_g1_i1.p1 TRINITY_DN21149_c0_g1~~TRINITY_DN21149_c0_g1_i1.p1  ORF type:complete len:334 (+),score=54.67 TRINITY_DN21149_c0_g1_i1:833-1834(+)
MSDDKKPLSKRQLRHRKTEAVRRQRINAATQGMRDVLGLTVSSDQAAVLEAALYALKCLQQRCDNCRCGACNQPQQTVSPSSSDDDLLDQYQQPPKRANTYTIVAPDNTTALMTTEDLPWLDTSLDDIDTSSASAISTNLDLDLDLDALHSSDLGLALPEYESPTSSPFTTEPEANTKDPWLASSSSSWLTGRAIPVDTFMLSSTVGIFLNNAEFKFLDCNQASLSIMQLPNKDAVRAMDEQDACTDLDLVLDPEAARCSNEHMAHSDVVVSLQRLRRGDGSVIWLHTCMIRVVHSNAKPGYMGIIQHVSAPSDGRAKVWTSDHLVHVGMSVN